MSPCVKSFDLSNANTMFKPENKEISIIRDCNYDLVITARVRSTTGRYCFHRCLSVHRGGRGGRYPPRGVGGYPGPGTPPPPGGEGGVRVPPRGVPRSGYPPGGGGSGYPPGGVRFPPWGGYPGPGTPPGGVPRSGTPPGGYPGPGTPPGGVQVPPTGGVPRPPRGGTRVRYPPGGGT